MTTLASLYAKAAERPPLRPRRLLDDAWFVVRTRPILIVLSALAGALVIEVLEQVSTAIFTSTSFLAFSRVSPRGVARAFTVCSTRSVLLGLCTRVLLGRARRTRATELLVRTVADTPAVLMQSVLMVATIGVGIAFCVLPGFYAMIVLCLAPAVRAASGCGPLDSLRASKDFAYGRRLLLAAILFGAQACAVWLGVLVFGAIAELDLGATAHRVAMAAGSLALETFASLVSCVFLAAAYAQLAFDPEARKLEEDVAVFS